MRTIARLHNICKHKQAKVNAGFSLTLAQLLGRKRVGGIATPTFTECTYFILDDDMITDYDPAGGTDVIIPDECGGITIKRIINVLSTGQNGFRNKGLTSVIFSSSLTHIGGRAFQDNQLTSVIIPDNIISLGQFAFFNNSLTSVSIGNNVPNIPTGAFRNNQLTSVVIPDSVSFLGSWSFLGSNITSVVLGSGLTSIQQSAFFGCPITSITIGANVDINTNVDTMGSNHGFKDVYDSDGQRANIYNWNGTNWIIV